MCTSPITIRVPSSSFDIQRGAGPYKEVQVPCGKCFECLSKRQNSLSIRCEREAVKKGSCHFLTLTYDNQHLPISHSLWRVNVDSGEYEQLSDPIFDNSPVLPKIRNLILDDYESVSVNKPRIYDFLIEFDESYELGFKFFVRFTPSLCYTDVRLWLKRCRVAYERLYGKKMSDFTYAIVGEYGQKRTRRPHYHCLFFGLSDFEASYLESEWKLGFTCLKSVKQTNSGFAKVAQYLGKYCAKGCFDSPAVLQNLTVKSRLCTSKHLGSTLNSNELGFWRCYDVFGKYDVNSVSPDNTKLFEMIKSRLYYSFVGLPDIKFSLPASIKNQIFGNYVYNKKLSKSALQVYYSDYIRNQISYVSEREFKSFVLNSSPKNISKAVVEFEIFNASFLKSRYEIGKQSLLRKLQRSVF